MDREIVPTKYNKPSKEDIRKKLNQDQFRITQKAGTETPFMNEYWSETRLGIYVDIVSDEPLFFSKDKFDSGCGWPSFSKPIEESLVQTKNDMAHGMNRTEVRSKTADSHLGHVFTDGPKEMGGLRYCINSAAMKFIPKEKMEEEGYGYLLPFVD